MTLGLERAGLTTAAFCEIEPYCQAILRKHWSDKPIFPDVTKLNRKVLDESGITFDVLAGGFPCTDISLIGKQAGLTGSQSKLFFEMLRLVEECRPTWLIIENVSSLRVRGADTVLSLSWKNKGTPAGRSWWVLGRSERTKKGKGSGLLPTVSARDWKDTPGMATKRKDGKSRLDQLARRIYFLDNVPQGGGLLTPEFCEFHMGYPNGWTALP